MKAYLYWIHLTEHDDLLTQGYVGVSARNLERRLIEHKSNLQTGSHNNPHLKNALNKYGNDIQMSVLAYNTEDYCYEMERVLRPTAEIGWNIAPGGSKPPGGVKGVTGTYERTEAHRKAYSIRSMGENNPFYGKKHTEEMKCKMRKPKTEEHKRKISEGKKGKCMGNSNAKGKRI